MVPVMLSRAPGVTSMAAVWTMLTGPPQRLSPEMSTRGASLPVTVASALPVMLLPVSNDGFDASAPWKSTLKTPLPVCVTKTKAPGTLFTEVKPSNSL